MAEFGQRLRQLRAEKELDGAEFARRASIALGRDVIWTLEIYPLERGWLTPTDELLRAIATVVNSTPASLLFKTTVKKAPPGRGSSLTESQRSELQELVVNHAPDAIELIDGFIAAGATAAFVEPWLHHFSLSDSLEWMRVGAEVSEALTMTDGGLQPEDLQVLRTCGFQLGSVELETAIDLGKITKSALSAAFWLKCGLDESAAVNWIETGWDLLAATCWAVHGFGPETSWEWWVNHGTAKDLAELSSGLTASDLASWRSSGVNRDEWLAWNGAGVPAHNAAEWMEDLFDPEQAATWQSLGASPHGAIQARSVGLSIEEAVRWRTHGWTVDQATEWVRSVISLPDAEEWGAQGIGPDAAAALIAKGVDHETAQPWLTSGVQLDQIDQWIHFGFDPPAAATWSFIDPWRAHRAVSRRIPPERLIARNSTAEARLRAAERETHEPLDVGFMDSWEAPDLPNCLPGQQRRASQRERKQKFADVCMICFMVRSTNGSCFCV